jgi:hypothetical protein
MGGRHTIFEDPITWTQDIRKTKFHLVRFFFTHPLNLLQINFWHELDSKKNIKKKLVQACSFKMMNNDKSTNAFGPLHFFFILPRT